MNSYKFSVFLGLLLIALSSCNTSKYLQENQVLLKSNKIQILGKKSIENKIQLTEQLSTLFRQKPNTNYLKLIPREWIYLKDSWITRALSNQKEPPALLDTTLCIATQKNMINFLFNQGYFNANCYYQVKLKKKRKTAAVTYFVTPGDRFYINDIKFHAQDSNVLKLLKQHEEASFLSPGNPLDNNLFLNEKARIGELMFQHGYMEFNPVYIQTLEVDTIRLKANLKLIVNNPEGKDAHPQYTVNRIDINPFYLASDSLDYQPFEHDSMTYHLLPYYKFIKPKVISSKILFRPGQLANKTHVDESYTKLSKLGIYRFINIEAKIDSLGKNKINYSILMSPLKKWVLDFGADFNYTSIKKVSRTLFGISGFTHLKNRNLFKGAESFSTKLEIGTELDLFNLSKLNSISFHYSNELSLPSFYDLTGTVGLYNYLSKPFKNAQLNEDSRTNIKIGADYEILTTFYNYTSLNATIEYDWQFSRKRISLHTLGFSLYFPNTTLHFDTLILSNNPFLENSFKGRRLFTSYLLDNFNFYYQSKIVNNKQHAFIWNVNLSGLEVHAINKLYNSITNTSKIFSVGEFEFSKFIKTQYDYRFYYTFSERNRLATRLALGVVVPFGASKSVPYIKQLYAGGPQSLRAWNIRELGPGGAIPAENIKDNQIFFAAGDFKIEANVEYRFDIIWIFKGAMFLDVGNIWLLPNSENKNKPETLNNTFYKDLAVGTGMGLRIDLSYFLFRIDVGFKLRNPYRDKVYDKYWIFHEKNPVSLNNLFENSTFHLALDYPF